MTKIAVFGAGTWGIALARLLAANGRDVTVWSAIPAELKSLSTTHRHPNLPGMELPAAMHYTADIAEACTDRDILLFAVPSPFVRATAKKAAPHIPEGQLIVDVAKGVEDKTLMTMSEIIEDELAKAGRKARVVALSGPTHAEEVARDMPTAIVAASADEDAAKTVQKVFTTPTFRVYTNDDRRGTELGGAVKNVIALAVGIALGLGYGDNAKAALITLLAVDGIRDAFGYILRTRLVGKADAGQANICREDNAAVLVVPRVFLVAAHDAEAHAV